MKKITFIALTLLTASIDAQSTFAIYTESPEVGEGVPHLRFVNGQGFALTEPTSTPYEGTENYLFSFNGSSSYFHGILFPRNAANTSDVTVDLSEYSYYNLAVKTESTIPFYIRMRGNTIIAKVLIDPSANSYGFANDGEWHFMSIPFADFIPEAGSFSLASITEIFVLRSNTPGSTAGLNNDFEFDNIYVSDGEILSVEDARTVDFKMFPNPAITNLTINVTTTIDNIKIYNLLGQKVMEQNPMDNVANFDVSSLQSGLYMVAITSQGRTATTKLIKE